MNKSDDPGTLITGEFVSALSKRFQIDLDPSVLIDELKSITRRYALDQRIFSSQTSEQTLRTNYQKLKSETKRLRQLLLAPEYEDLETDLYWAAHHKIEPQSDTGIPVVGHAHPKLGSHYLAELENLLALLESAAEIGIERFSPVRGRKRNYVLENLVRRLAHVWSDMLNRKFSVDYHQGAGITEASEFVSFVIAELNTATSETEIITAMRTVIKERGQ